MKDAKSISGFPNYLVNKSGQVFSVKRGDPIEINGSVWQGYRKVTLSNGSKTKTIAVHRLVAQTFLNKPRGSNIVNHIDGDKSNNKVSNLEWTNHRGNSKHYSEKLAPVYKVKRTKQKQDLVQAKLSVLDYAYSAYKNNPELFAKLYGVTFNHA